MKLEPEEQIDALIGKEQFASTFEVMPLKWMSTRVLTTDSSTGIRRVHMRPFVQLRAQWRQSHCSQASANFRLGSVSCILLCHRQLSLIPFSQADFDVNANLFLENLMSDHIFDALIHLLNARQQDGCKILLLLVVFLNYKKSSVCKWVWSASLAQLTVALIAFRSIIHTWWSSP